MKTVRDVMRSDVDVLRTTESATDAACFLAARAEDSIPLCLADGRLAGSVSSRDIVVKVVAKGRDPRQVTLAELADPSDVLGLEVDAPIDEAVSLMHRRQRSRLPVTEGNRVIGVVTQRDAARCLALGPSRDDG
jgi:CBS domain-containing protein